MNQTKNEGFIKKYPVTFFYILSLLLGFILIFAVIIAGAVLIYSGKQVSGLVLVISAIATPVGILWKSEKDKKQ